MPKYFQNDPKFNSNYSRNNLPIIKDGTYEYILIGAHWIPLFVSGDNVT